MAGSLAIVVLLEILDLSFVSHPVGPGVGVVCQRCVACDCFFFRRMHWQRWQRCCDWLHWLRCSYCLCLSDWLFCLVGRVGRAVRCLFCLTLPAQER